MIMLAHPDGAEIGAGKRALKSVCAWLTEAFDLVIECLEKSGQRRALTGLDDRMLKDMGISRCDAYREYAKPFWR